MRICKFANFNFFSKCFLKNTLENPEKLAKVQKHLIMEPFFGNFSSSLQFFHGHFFFFKSHTVPSGCISGSKLTNIFTNKLTISHASYFEEKSSCYSVNEKQKRTKKVTTIISTFFLIFLSK